MLRYKSIDFVDFLSSEKTHVAIIELGFFFYHGKAISGNGNVNGIEAN